MLFRPNTASEQAKAMIAVPRNSSLTASQHWCQLENTMRVKKTLHMGEEEYL